MVDVEDAEALAMGDTLILDVKKNEIWEPHFLMGTPNAGIWIDNDPTWDQELDPWADTETCDYALCCHGQFFEDGSWRQERYLVPINVTLLLEDPTVTDMRPLQKPLISLAIQARMKIMSGVE